MSGFRRLALSGTLLAAAFVAGVGAQQPAAAKSEAAKGQDPSPPKGDAANGKKIYVSYGCYQCHNYAANGGAAGPRLAPHPLPFGEFIRYVRKPTDEMPPYTAKVVSDREIADIYAFLLTVPEPPAVDGAKKGARR
jgi:mono/diheme cytochrome c family protein